MMLAANTIIGFPFFNCKQTFIVYLSAITRMKTTHFDNDLRENCQHTLSQLNGVFFKFDRNALSSKQTVVPYICDDLKRLKGLNLVIDQDCS